MPCFCPAVGGIGFENTDFLVAHTPCAFCQKEIHFIVSVVVVGITVRRVVLRVGGVRFRSSVVEKWEDGVAGREVGMNGGAV